ncbi:MAG: rhodanese-like domain-containing protein [Proteobacteria bacterium]|nr:rhodanese-like domain-containing protein [Pseudomonadota bacterium]
MALQNLDPKDVARWLAEKSIMLIDVREPAEYEAERIQGALLFPLSSFNPKALPEPKDLKIVFQCGSGMRSAKAVAACEMAGLPFDSHVNGGIQAWKAAGLPTAGIGPATGKAREKR